MRQKSILIGLPISLSLGLALQFFYNPTISDQQLSTQITTFATPVGQFDFWQDFVGENQATSNHASKFITQCVEQQNQAREQQALQPEQHREQKVRELQLASFKKKINEHLSNEFKVAVYKASDFIKASFAQRQAPPFFLEIDKTGLIKRFSLVGSSGSDALDKFVQKTIIQAAPFPPIPRHLNLETFCCAD